MHWVDYYDLVQNISSVYWWTLHLHPKRSRKNSCNAIIIYKMPEEALDIQSECVYWLHGGASAQWMSHIHHATSVGMTLNMSEYLSIVAKCTDVLCKLEPVVFRHFRVHVGVQWLVIRNKAPVMITHHNRYIVFSVKTSTIHAAKLVCASSWIAAYSET